MCTFNGADYLQAQLNSIALQTRLPDELIICDDGSIDSTQAIVETFMENASIPVSLHVNEHTLGVRKNFEQAIELCSGDLIALSDQDDVWNSTKLQRLEKAFAESPDVGLVFSDAELVDADLNSMGTTMWQALEFDVRKRKLIELGRFDLLMPGCTVTGATMAFRSKYRKLCLPIPTDLPMLHDAWIALTIASIARLVAIDETLIKYRQHEKQQLGAPEPQKDDGRRVPIRTALSRPSWSSEFPEVPLRLKRRLEESRKSFECQAALQKLQGYLSHFEMRTNLGPGRLVRIPLILRELTSRRYHLYSNGFQSAAKDLFSSRRRQ